MRIMRTITPHACVLSVIILNYFFALEMPRTYSRKTAILSYTEENLGKALEAIRNGQPIRRAGRAFKIPESTLRKYRDKDRQHLPRLGRKTVFSPELETDLTD